MRVLITGAAIRVGREIAREFAAAGHQVAIHYRQSAAAAEELLEELGGAAAGHLLVQAELDNPAELEALVPRLFETGPPLDCLVNNAATFPRTQLVDETLAGLTSTFHTNCFAPVVLMRDFAIHAKRGSIINLLDQRIDTVNPDVGAYAVAKKALRDFTLAAALDWAPAIRVNAVAPGLTIAPEDVLTEARGRQIARIPMQRETSPGEIASACRYLAEADTITGQILYLDGGLHLTRLA